MAIISLNYRILLRVVNQAAIRIDPLSQKRSFFVVGPVRGKIEFSQPDSQDTVCIAHSVSPWIPK
ncbi:hypothetical protein FFB58_18330 [Enterobacter sp. MF024]|nr:hypothetical protein FHN83_16725 [Leclercia adecarboxylata]TLU64963.1 hypothetical protein FFB58_18330 [Enterobacter sp. MF024]